MRYLAAFLLTLLIPAWVLAVDLTCTVPPGAATTRGSELCEMLRQHLEVRPADWDNDVCATEFLRRGLKMYELQVTKAAAEETVRDAVHDARIAFDANYPPDFTPAVCGDGVVDDTDPDLEEQCDPPNGTTCDDNCQTIP